jgi:hypothetical protein
LRDEFTTQSRRRYSELAARSFGGDARYYPEDKYEPRVSYIYISTLEPNRALIPPHMSIASSASKPRFSTCLPTTFSLPLLAFYAGASNALSEQLTGCQAISYVSCRRHQHHTTEKGPVISQKRSNIVLLFLWWRHVRSRHCTWKSRNAPCITISHFSNRAFNRARRQIRHGPLRCQMSGLRDGAYTM